LFRLFPSRTRHRWLLSCGNILDITDAEPLAGHRISCMDISMS
jgi:hypothetical protein